MAEPTDKPPVTDPLPEIEITEAPPEDAPPEPKGQRLGDALLQAQRDVARSDARKAQAEAVALRAEREARDKADADRRAAVTTAAEREVLRRFEALPDPVRRSVREGASAREKLAAVAAFEAAQPPRPTPSRIAVGLAPPSGLGRAHVVTADDLQAMTHRQRLAIYEQARDGRVRIDVGSMMDDLRPPEAARRLGIAASYSRAR